METRVSVLEAKWDAVVPTLATKSDMTELRLATKADMAELRADMHEMNAGISRWMLSTTITIIGTVVLGFAGLMYNLSGAKSSAPAAQPAQPIVITIPQSVAPAAPSTH
ncbi:MAG: hypothetical protein IIA02_08375 [Proteobacteria bacterium]|nr:hypothetical protein [Pseudomonadota bacterium]